jgi:hypothetical protein
MDAWLPWNTYPGLALERLVIVANVVRVARTEAIEEHRPDKGETNWSLGVRQFERQNNSIVWAAQSNSWLTVLSGAGGGPVQFVFAIGGHSIRVCRGGPDEVPARYQQLCFPEVLQQQAVLDIDGEVPPGICLRMAIENGSTGAPADIYLDEIDEETGTVLRNYLVPQVAMTTQITPFAPPQAAPANIPPVTAQPVQAAATSTSMTGSE